MQIKLKEARQEGVTGGTLKIVVDGYNAPVTGGNFVDLVQRGFYNNMEIQRADGFVVQTGDPGAAGAYLYVSIANRALDSESCILATMTISSCQYAPFIH